MLHATGVSPPLSRCPASCGAASLTKDQPTRLPAAAPAQEPATGVQRAAGVAAGVSAGSQWACARSRAGRGWPAVHASPAAESCSTRTEGAPHPTPLQAGRAAAGALRLHAPGARQPAAGGRAVGALPEDQPAPWLPGGGGADSWLGAWGCAHCAVHAGRCSMAPPGPPNPHCRQALDGQECILLPGPSSPSKHSHCLLTLPTFAASCRRQVLSRRDFYRIHLQGGTPGLSLMLVRVSTALVAVAAAGVH